MSRSFSHPFTKSNQCSLQNRRQLEDNEREGAGEPAGHGDARGVGLHRGRDRRPERERARGQQQLVAPERDNRRPDLHILRLPDVLRRPRHDRELPPPETAAAPTRSVRRFYEPLSKH